MTPRFLARAISFLIEASLRSISGASPPSASISGVSFFAMLNRRLLTAGEGRQPIVHLADRRTQMRLFGEPLLGHFRLQFVRRLLESMLQQALVDQHRQHAF